MYEESRVRIQCLYTWPKRKRLMCGPDPDPDPDPSLVRGEVIRILLET